MTVEINAQRAAYTQWDVHVQELADAEQDRLTAAREAAADAMEESLSLHMKGHFCTTCLDVRASIPLQLAASLQSFSDAPPKKEISQILRLTVINFAVLGPVAFCCSVTWSVFAGAPDESTLVVVATGPGSVALGAPGGAAAPRQG